MRLFLPTPRQTNFLILLGCAVIALGFYLRHSIVDAEPLIAACAMDATGGHCRLGQFVIELHRMQFFGAVALIAAALHLIRPHISLFTVALVATCLGILLMNTSAAALAAALLVIAFARPVRASTRPPVRPIAPQTTRPASLKSIH